MTCAMIDDGEDEAIGVTNPRKEWSILIVKFRKCDYFSLGLFEGFNRQNRIRFLFGMTENRPVWMTNNNVYKNCWTKFA